MVQNVCIRCGKVRIKGATWKEKSDRGAVIFHEQSVCPDAECQKLVDKKFEEMRERKRLLTEHKQQAQAQSQTPKTA